MSVVTNYLWMTLLLNITIIVSIVQQNQSCKTENVVTSLWMNLLLNINVIVSIVQQNLPCNLHENGVMFLWIIVSIVQQTFWQRATFNYSDSLLLHLAELVMMKTADELVLKLG